MRPRYYDSPEQMENAIEEYFDNEPKSTITGLILHLGFSHREAMADYEKRDGFSDIIKRARLRVEHSYEKNLSSQTCTGAIFALKNMGWRDKTEVDNSHSFKNRPSITLDFGNIAEEYTGD